jgi:hypothetical protein
LGLGTAVEHVLQARTSLTENNIDGVRTNLKQVNEIVTEALQQLRTAQQRLETIAALHRWQSHVQKFSELAERQGQLALHTKQRREQHDAAGRWTRSELKALLDDAQTQQSLAEVLEQSGQELSETMVLAAFVNMVEQDMQISARQLRQRDVSISMEQSQQRLQRRLNSLMQAFGAAAETGSVVAASMAEDRGESVQQTLGDTTELLLLIAWQEDLADQTELLLNNTELSSADRTQEQNRLATEQQQLASWLQQLVE